MVNKSSTEIIVTKYESGELASYGAHLVVGFHVERFGGAHFVS
jgi:hypothetical protein